MVYRNRKKLKLKSNFYNYTVKVKIKYSDTSLESYRFYSCEILFLLIIAKVKCFSKLSYNNIMSYNYKNIFKLKQIDLNKENFINKTYFFMLLYSQFKHLYDKCCYNQCTWYNKLILWKMFNVFCVGDFFPAGNFQYTKWWFAHFCPIYFCSITICKVWVLLPPMFSCF